MFSSSLAISPKYLLTELAKKSLKIIVMSIFLGKKNLIFKTAFFQFCQMFAFVKVLPFWMILLPYLSTSKLILMVILIWMVFSYSFLMLEEVMNIVIVLTSLSKYSGYLPKYKNMAVQYKTSVYTICYKVQLDFIKLLD